MGVRERMDEIMLLCARECDVCRVGGGELRRELGRVTIN